MKFKNAAFYLSEKKTFYPKYADMDIPPGILYSDVLIESLISDVSCVKRVVYPCCWPSYAPPPSPSSATAVEPSGISRPATRRTRSSCGSLGPFQCFR